MEGQGAYKYPNGGVLKEIDWENNKPDGSGYYYPPNGSERVLVAYYKGEWIDPRVSKMR